MQQPVRAHPTSVPAPHPVHTDVPSPSLCSLVHDIIGKHSDLMAMFNEFLMRCEVGPDDPYTRQYPRDRNRVGAPAALARVLGFGGSPLPVPGKGAGHGAPL